MLKLSQNGDTIVEVLISLAVLSLAFGISYATANRALEVSQNAQEHSLALEYLDAQFEGLKYVASVPGQNIVPAAVFTSPGKAFCLMPGTPPNTSLQYEVAAAPSCLQQASGFSYSISITPEGQDNFLANVTWPGLGKLGPQSEQIAYRVYPQ